MTYSMNTDRTNGGLYPVPSLFGRTVQLLIKTSDTRSYVNCIFGYETCGRKDITSPLAMCVYPSSSHAHLNKVALFP
jgi:hypothetical protein